MNPKCPKCGREMTGGAPHGPWAIQYECRGCNVYTQGDPHRLASPPDRCCRFTGVRLSGIECPDCPNATGR